MGYLRRHAILITDNGCDKFIDEAHMMAKDIFKDSVSEILGPFVNNERSFFIAPDGSKEYWDESDAGDERRAKFLGLLENFKYEDGSCPLVWAEVQCGSLTD